ncbi:hypothetical protein BV20DRAFT_733291 [Pilatotrama ljubarskyi]|nr:hypothetical protein BV20DRAFT_733291 [Pilatotrama ljubarskyi]
MAFSSSCHSESPSTDEPSSHPSGQALCRNQESSSADDLSRIVGIFKQRADTRCFVAIQLLRTGPKKADIAQEARHDLESFYWLLQWAVFCHPTYAHLDPSGTCARLFKCGVWESARARDGWMFCTKWGRLYRATSSCTTPTGRKATGEGGFPSRTLQYSDSSTPPSLAPTGRPTKTAT